MDQSTARPFALENATKARNPVDVHVGARIGVLRLYRGIKQDALAKMIGATVSEVQEYEFGDSRITAERLRRISGILDAPSSYFFEKGALVASD